MPRARPPVLDLHYVAVGTGDLDGALEHAKRTFEIGDSPRRP